MADSPEEALLKLDRRTTLRAKLAQMSPEHRETIDLIYDQGKTVTEAAEIIQVPKNTIKTRMFCARKALQQLLVTAAEWGRVGRRQSAERRAYATFLDSMRAIAVLSRKTSMSR